MASKMNLSEEQETEKPHRSMQGEHSLGRGVDFRKISSFSELSCIEEKGADPPELNRVSMKSEDSMIKGQNFSDTDCTTEFSFFKEKGADLPKLNRVSMKGEDSLIPGPNFTSGVSMKSEDSMDQGLNFSNTDCTTEFSFIKEKGADLPKLNRVSMKSEESLIPGPNFTSTDCSTEFSFIKEKGADPPEPSCVSMKSEDSMDQGLNFSNTDCTTEFRPQKQTPNSTSESKLDFIFKELEHKVISLLKDQLKKFKKLLSPRGVEDEKDQSSFSKEALTITLHVLKSMNQKDLANRLQIRMTPACHQSLKSKLKERFQKMNKGISHHATSTLLNEIYTELYVTEDGSEEFNNEHEVRQIETASSTPSPETSIKCNDLFKNDVVRTVLTKGVAGIGKTIFVQKFILDWAEGKSNQEVNFIFPLPFRELNLMRNQNLSLEDLLNQFFPDTKKLKPLDYVDNKVLFIFDGLDESQLPLDFHNNERLTTVTQVASVDALITNLIKGNLLRSALLWITSRPAAASQIPLDCIDQVTEVQGFNDHQKEEYFRKKIIDQSLANSIITHVRSSRSLYSMCHIPVFCWIAATVLEEMLGDAEIREIPKTLTQMFTHFLIFQIKLSGQKYQGKTETDPDQFIEVIWKLGKLAFHKLEEGNLVFYEEDLKQCGIDVREMSVFSGLLTQILSKDFGLHIGKVFSFVHQTVQEFLAALYTFFSFIFYNKNVLEQTGWWYCFGKSTVSDFLKHAVNKALESENGHLDLFLRFLLGLSVESNQTLFRGLLPQSASSSDSKEATINHIKMKIRENASPEKSINLFHCLNELNDHSLVQEIQRFFNSGGSLCLRDSKLSQAQWSALVFVLLNSEKKLDEIELDKYDPSEECLQRLFPVVKASRKALLWSCNLTEKSCEVLASALSSSHSTLRELDLTDNKLQDSGAILLYTGLKSSHCKLEILRLCICNLTERSCADLASALSSNSSLKELDLSNNELHDSGVKDLSAGLHNPRCKLEILRLSSCNLTEESCAVLVSCLNSNPSCLRELDLSSNKLQDSGVQLLSSGLENRHCKLEKLGLFNCSITEEGCAALATALKLNPSLPLRDLNLKHNLPGDSKPKELLALQEDPQYKLETLLI